MANRQSDGASQDLAKGSWRLRFTRREDKISARMRKFGAPLHRSASQSLGIGNARKRQILGHGINAFDLAIEQHQLLTQGGMTMFGERFDQVLDHGTQASYDLQAVTPAPAYFGKGEIDEIFPIRRSKNHSQLAGFVGDLVGAEMPPADHSQ